MQRFIESMGHTLYFTVLAVVLPILFGTAAALVFHREFPVPGPAAHDLRDADDGDAGGGRAGLDDDVPPAARRAELSAVPVSASAPQAWVYSPDTVIPTLVLVEVWHWTPLVMLIVLGGLAGLPREPYESALIDGANDWHMFRHITLPLVWPFIMVAIVIRTIDALKAFDTIFVITQGGPGTASETLNIFLYLQAFQFYKIGYASAVVVIFFVIVIMLSLLLLYARQKSKWNA